MKVKNKTKWLLRPAKPDLEKEICGKSGLHPLIAKLLINRGIFSVAEVDKFLNVSLSNLHDPMLMADMDIAVERIFQAIQNKERIMVYGDYDVDGISATSLLSIFFNEIGVEVSHYIPHRIEEGYGLNMEAIRKIVGQKVSLLITVDCGVTSVDEVDEAAKSGLDVIITDHHQVSDTLPRACAILNPTRSGCNYPFKYLAGVGIAFKLITALEQEFLKRGTIDRSKIPNLKNYLCLVALGTLADMVPLVGENHTLASLGLSQMEKTKRVGLRALINLGNFGSRPLNATDIGFFLAPRINAVGRLQHAELGVELMMTKDRHRGKEIAKILDQENRKRQLMQQRILDEVLLKIKNNVDLEKDKAIILASEGWHPGVIGIVASKLVELYNRPAILLNIKNGVARGSARSIPNFHIYNGLKSCREKLIHFGGHKYAAGLTVKASMIDEFREALMGVVNEKLKPSAGERVMEIDAEVGLKDITADMVEEIYSLDPFGSGNPYPVFLSRGVSFVDTPYLVGKGNEHVRFEVSNNGFNIGGIGFGMSKSFEGVDCSDGKFDIVFTPSINTRGYMSRTVQLKLCDFRPAE